MCVTEVGSSPPDNRVESLANLQEQSLSVVVVPTDLLAYAGQAAELVETSIDKLHGVLLLDDGGFAITIVPVVRHVFPPPQQLRS